ncbi:hypothetical protein [Paracoccus sp. (in: a-proteobacteria)]|uniref:hypothetical protein n=1 Tax=Paracoccus sp. TaxID=267 RepID=UPI0028AF6A7C|nr:hypothetical protein [Paracoccus sp. (in: a-proteobacteria)]
MPKDPKDNIVRLIKEQAQISGASSLPMGGGAITVSGSGNIVATGGTVTVFHAPASTSRRRPAPPKPAGECISADQRAVLRDLVAQVVETEAALKKRPKTHSAVWSSLNGQFDGVSTYSQIPREGFEMARAYLNSWLGRLNGMRSAPVKNGDAWRKRKYAYIYANCSTAEDQDAMRDYIRRNFGTERLKDLANEELERTYRYVAGRRNRRK